MQNASKLFIDYSDSWNPIFEKLGRFMDFDNEYKTMDSSFMESVWWVFLELWNKDLIYLGYKVMPFSTHCCTPLSNFEAGQNYKDVDRSNYLCKIPSCMESNIIL